MNIVSEALEPPPSSLKYLPQLDSVRAFAVLLVLWHHWRPQLRAPGSLGVWIFFVLSGFLITRILLKARRDTATENRKSLVNFYIRRFLRIFPLYYFVLIVSFAVSAAFRINWYWYASYLQNFMMIMAGKDDYIFGTHLWSLAVEEQFYVVWPLIALFAPRIVLLPLILLSIALAVATRYYCTHIGWSTFEVYIFTPASLDTLGCGALLAYFVTYRPKQVVWLRWISLAIGVGIVGASLLFKFRVGSTGMLPLIMGLSSLWLVSIASDGVPGRLGQLISLAPLIYIGRISYGIYVYHYFVPIVLEPYFKRYSISPGDPLFLVICFFATMIVASLSWFLMEKPINELKDKLAGSPPPSKPKDNLSLNDASAG